MSVGRNPRSALVLGLGNLDLEAVARRFSPRTPARWIAGYYFVAALLVSSLWISLWIKFLVTGLVPEINGSQDMYKVVAVVDFSFMVSLMIPAAFSLWRRRPWGYVLGVMISIQGAAYNAVMGLICLFGWMRTPGSHLSGWFINCIVGTTLCLLCLAAFLLNVKRPAELNRLANDLPESDPLAALTLERHRSTTKAWIRATVSN